jgi:hypothetical protein
MKPKIAVFGLPSRKIGKFVVGLRVRGSSANYGHEVFSQENDQTGSMTGHPSELIKIGEQITFVISSFGIKHHTQTTTYLGGDISYVPYFEKDTSLSEKMVAQYWEIAAWQNWNPRVTHNEGVQAENKALFERLIVKMPIQDSYYYESRIDYTEKFHKLWIGLNAYASGYSGETSDELKILALVSSPLREAFNAITGTVTDNSSANVYIALQKATGLNMSSNIVRDEIGRSCSIFDFLHNAKSLSASYAKNVSELSGLIFLGTSSASEPFYSIFSRYHQQMASDEGIVAPFNLADAFKVPFAPESVERLGRLLFHNPFKDNSKGSLFGVTDFFGPIYAGEPYVGQIDRNGGPLDAKQKYEKIDPLFFRYLRLLYDFRCAYFHGSLAATEQNNELARTAYTSMRDIFPAILR